MDPTLIWILAALAIVVVIGAVWYERTRRRSRLLKERFGPEYDRVVQTTGDTRKAEAALEQRVRHVERLTIRPLPPQEAAAYADSWRIIQTRFVDDPDAAVVQADRLVGEVMHARGYPLGDFEQRVADISVDHPDVVMNYRAAREIAQQHATGDATTEDLRQAMVHYRALFDDLLEKTRADHSDHRVEHEHRTEVRR